MDIEKEIIKKVEEFFLWINLPIVQNYYIRNSQNWDALCASLQIIIDLQRPKNEYYGLESIDYLSTIGTFLYFSNSGKPNFLQLIVERMKFIVPRAGIEPPQKTECLVKAP